MLSEDSHKNRSRNDCAQSNECINHEQSKKTEIPKFTVRSQTLPNRLPNDILTALVILPNSASLGAPIPLRLPSTF